MQKFVFMLLMCSVTVSAIAICYMAMTPMLRKRYSEKWCYYAWLVLVIGLIIPFRPQFNNAPIKVDIPGEMAATTIRVADGTPLIIPTPNENAVLSLVTPSISVWQITTLIWLAGALVYLAYHLIKYYRFEKMAGRWSERITDEMSIGLLQKLKTEIGITTQIRLYKCLSVGSPMLIGMIRPRILLPNATLAQDELRFILKHELIHFKRKDLYYKTLVMIATAIHWFNPVVHLMGKAIDEQCELSCDAETVSSADADTRQLYSEAIIGVVKYQSKLKTAFSTNFYGGKKGMKNRITSIFNTKKKRTGIILVCAILVLTLGTGAAFAVGALSTSALPTTTSFDIPNESTNNGQRINLSDIGGASIDIREDEILSRELDATGALFTAEILKQFGIDTSSLPITTSFCRGSRYGDIWIFGTANKEYRFTAVIEYGTNEFIELYAETQNGSVIRPTKSDSDSSLPDGFTSPVLLETDNDGGIGGPIEVDSMSAEIVSVNRNDEDKFSPEEWADILKKVDKGEILFFETREEEVEYFHGNFPIMVDLPKQRPLNVNSARPEEDVREAGNISESSTIPELRLPSDEPAEYTVKWRVHPVTKEELLEKVVLATGEVTISYDEGVTWQSPDFE
jgi:beta-lactamase regulating signal transducer with metallopeptidase domain